MTYLLLGYLNNVYEDGTFKITIGVVDQERGLEFLDCRIKCVEGNLSVDIFAKPTKSFTYVKPLTCYPRGNINNAPRGIALRLCRIFDTDKRLESHISGKIVSRSLKNNKTKRPEQRDLKVTRSVK